MRKIALLLILLPLSVLLKADDGMWLLTDLKQIMPQLEQLGCECDSTKIMDELYPNVPHFGGGCSSEIVSPEGLLLTNLHCAYKHIQGISTTKNDYLKNGYWAVSQKEELPIAGLTVKLPVRMKDITKELEKAVAGIKGKKKREEAGNKFIQEQIAKERKKEKSLSVSVKRMLGGAQYVLFVSRVYSDVRLVGTPPESIGKFGKDLDNWMWPRHNADFSFLRIYADSMGNPSVYSETNLPLKTPNHIQLSAEGVQENDLVFIIGYPGSTRQYATSFEVAEKKELNVLRHAVRSKKLETMKKSMDIDERIYLQYSSKYASVSNYWKHAKMQNASFENLDVIAEKEAKEQAFQTWLLQQPKAPSTLLSDIKAIYQKRREKALELLLLQEAVRRGAELPYFAKDGYKMKELLLDGQHKMAIEELEKKSQKFYRDYNLALDKNVSAELLRMYFEKTQFESLASLKKKIAKEAGGDYHVFVSHLYDASIFRSQEVYEQALKQKSFKEFKADPVYQLYETIEKAYDKQQKAYRKETGDLARLEDLYVQHLLKKSDEPMAPNANSTIRLAYGQVKGYTANGQDFPTQTYFEGVMKKHATGHVDYRLPEELKELYQKKDFGRYAVDGKLPTCFVANTFTTGGNSGSPVFNKKGEQVGVLFDGASEGLARDYFYEEEVARSIILDIRFVLFLTEKMGKMDWLINEMNLK